MEWKTVADYPAYQVSNTGLIRRLFKRRTTLCRPDGKNRRYLQIELSHKCKRRKFNVHVLVAAAFLGPRPHGLVINHVDGNRRNNNATNLEYCTQAENYRHAQKLGLGANIGRNIRGQFCSAAKSSDVGPGASF